MLCHGGWDDEVDPDLAELFSTLGFVSNSYPGVKEEPTLVDVKGTFLTEIDFKDDEATGQLDDFGSESDYGARIKPKRKSLVEDREDEDVNDNIFDSGLLSEPSSSEESGDEYKPKQSKEAAADLKRKKERERKRLWRKEGKKPKKPKKDKKLEKATKVSNTPVVWIKEPSPERLLNGKKTKHYFMPEGSFEEGPPYKCLVCDYKSKLTRNLRLHFHRIHVKEKLYKCIECDMRGVDWSCILNHWNRLHNPNREELLKFVCETCGKKYEIGSELKTHVLAAHGGADYPCKYCGKGFKTPNQRKAHEGSHEKEPAPCNICGKMLACAKDVKEHERVVHFNEDTVDCELCGKTLKTKRNLQLHMRTIHGTLEKNHHCHICEARFRVASQLKKHIETVHEKTRLFPCPFCSTVLSCKEKFKLHSQRLHQGREMPPELREQVMKPRIENFRVKTNASE